MVLDSGTALTMTLCASCSGPADMNLHSMMMHWMRPWASSCGSWARHSSPSHSSRSPCRRADGVYAPYALSSFCDTGLWPTAASPTGRIFWSAPCVCRVGHGINSLMTRVSSASTPNLLLQPRANRLLLALKRGYPEHFAAVCELKCSPREAGIRAGIIKTRRFRCGGVCDSPESSLPSGPALEPQSQSGHENGYNDTTPPEPSLSGVNDYEVNTAQGQAFFGNCTNGCRILIADLMSRQSTRRT